MGDPDYKQKRRARRKRNLVAKEKVARLRGHQVKRQGQQYQRTRVRDDDLRTDEDGQFDG